MACDHEVRHRNRKEDPDPNVRRPTQFLASCRPWRDRTRARLNDILRKNPFIDP